MPAITPENLSYGILNPKQRDKFIEFIKEESQLLQNVRYEVLEEHKVEIDMIGIQRRKALGVKNFNYSNLASVLAEPVTGRILLEAEEVMLPWEISERVLLRNIEKEGFEDHVAKLMAHALSLDIEDLCINGFAYDKDNPPATKLSANITATATEIPVDNFEDFPRSGESGVLIIENEKIKYTGKKVENGQAYFIGCIRGYGGTTPSAHSSGTDVVWEGDPLLSTLTGYLEKAEKGNIVDALVVSEGKVTKEVFFAAKRALPRRYHTANLRWIMNPITFEAFAEYLSNRLTAAGDRVLIGEGSTVAPLGIPAILVNSMPPDTMLLTDPKNLIWGVFEEIIIRKTTEGKEALYTRSRYYAAFMSIAAEIQETEGVVKVVNLTEEV